ncbi:hypothetical protein D3C73_1363390 [compost metagenome]
MELTSAICNTPSGDWTHMIDGRPVRLEHRVIDPAGHRLVFFRADSADGPYCGRWLARTFDKEAAVIEPEQLTLF